MENEICFFCIFFLAKKNILQKQKQQNNKTTKKQGIKNIPICFDGLSFVWIFLLVFGSFFFYYFGFENFLIPVHAYSLIMYTNLQKKKTVFQPFQTFQTLRLCSMAMRVSHFKPNSVLFTHVLIKFNKEVVVSVVFIFYINVIAL